MRVAQVTVNHPAIDNRILNRMARTLHEAGFDVTVIHPGEPDSVMVTGIKDIGLDLRGGRLLRMTVGALRAIAVVLRADLDVVHFHDPELLPWMAMLSYRDKSVIYDRHEDLPKSILTKDWVPGSIRRLTAAGASWVERLMTRRMHVIRAEESYPVFTRALSDTAVLNFPRKSDYRSYSEQAVAWPEPLVSRYPKLIYVGRIARQRGSFEMVQLVVELRSQGMDPGLLLIGPQSSQHDSDLRTEVAKSGVGDRVASMGQTPVAEAWSFAATADIGLCLLHDVPNYRNSVPSKILEYLAVGVLPLASDLPLTRAILEDIGVGAVATSFDPKDLAEDVKHLLVFRSSKVDLPSRYDWSATEWKLLDLYGRLQS